MGSSQSPFEDAHLYDVLFEDLQFDRDFYQQMAREIGGPVLEVACGTGRVLIPLLQAGFPVDGIDLYQPMLDRLRNKAANLGFFPNLLQADMRSFSLGRRYKLVFIAFNGFTHCLTTEDQLRALIACREHLSKEGCLVLTLFYPGRAILEGPEGTPVLEHETKDPATGRTFRLFDSRTMDRVRQVQHSRMEIREMDSDGNLLRSHFSETDMRWTYKPEMVLLLRAAGFPRHEIWGGFDRRPLESETDLMLVRAWKS
jgi:SAM-dependent methyltransferase